MMHHLLSKSQSTLSDSVRSSKTKEKGGQMNMSSEKQRSNYFDLSSKLAAALNPFSNTLKRKKVKKQSGSNRTKHRSKTTGSTPQVSKQLVLSNQGTLDSSELLSNSTYFDTKLYHSDEKENLNMRAIKLLQETREQEQLKEQRQKEKEKEEEEEDERLKSAVEKMTKHIETLVLSPLLTFSMKLEKDASLFLAQNTENSDTENNSKITQSLIQRNMFKSTLERKMSGREIPEIPLSDYLFRCVKYMNRYYKALQKQKMKYKSDQLKDNRSSLTFEFQRVDTELKYKDSVGLNCLLSSLLYFERLREKDDSIRLTVLNAHRIISVLMLIASKFLLDHKISQKFWAKVVGYSVQKLNEYEKILLDAMEFDLFVEQQDLSEIYFRYCEDLEV